MFENLSPFGVIGSVVIGTIVYLLIDFGFKYHKLSSIPGPLPIPLIGNLYMKDCVAKFQKYALKLREKYGGVFLFWAGNTAFVVVTEAKVMRQVLTDHKTFQKGWVYRDKFSVVFGEGLVTIQSGDVHKGHRSKLQRFFVKGNIEKKLPIVVHETLLSLKEVLTPGSDLKKFNVLEFFEFATVHIFFALECGVRDENWRKYPGRNTMIRTVNYGSHAIGNMIFLNLPTSKFLNPQVWKLKQYYMPMGRDFVDDLVAERKKRIANGEIIEEDCLSVLLKSRDDNDITQEEFYSHIFSLGAAGFETTAHFGAYTAYLLAKHPDIQRKVKCEIQRVLQGRSSISSEDLAQLEYLTCVLKESLRLYSIIPSVMRYTTKDVEVVQDDGTKIKIPKSTNVMLPFSSINRVDEYWERPHEFIPERFQGIKGESSLKHGYFPFAYGVRNCIGATFALVEGKVTFALLLQRLTLSLNPKHKPDLSSGISLVSRNGVQLSVDFEEGYNHSNLYEGYKGNI